MIATGYPPYLFSENLCNGKLAMALIENGVEIDAISKVDDGPSYGADWTAPWDVLEPTAHIVKYNAGNKLTQMVDVLYSGLKMGGQFVPGVRWARRAYEKALQLMKTKHYDAVMTRSPNDTAHMVGYMLKKNTRCRWIANWNDPAIPIWPGQYKHNLSPSKQKKLMKQTAMLLNAADVDTFPSDSLRAHFTEHFPLLKSHRTAILPHIGLVESAWPAGEPNLNDGKIRFLHSGNLSAERNPETTFQAMRGLIDDGIDSFEFHIMGHINDYSKELIAKYGLESHVKFIGSFPYLKALAKMQSYDVLVLLEARLEKGIFFASKITDYLQTGLPIMAISPEKGFAADLFKKGSSYYLANNLLADDIASTFKKVLSDFQCANRRFKGDMAKYRNFSPEAVVEEVRTLLNN